MRSFRWAYPPSSSLLMWQSDVPLFKSLVCSSRRWHISVLISRMRSWFTTRTPFLPPPRLHAKVCPDETSYVSYQCPVRNVVRAAGRTRCRQHSFLRQLFLLRIRIMQLLATEV